MPAGEKPGKRKPQHDQKDQPHAELLAGFGKKGKGGIAHASALAS
jgi:hypothetical protein